MRLKNGLIGLSALTIAACGSSENDIVDAGDTGTVEYGDETPITDDASEPQASVSEEPAGPQINVGKKTLSSPSDYQMAVVFFNVVGLEPPFKKWANADRRVRNVNEFDRPEVMERVQQELMLAAQSVSDIGFVEINTRTQFGEYDMTAQGYRINAIDPDRFWRWGYEGDRFTLTMENASQTDLWKVPRDEARTILESNPSRSVEAKILIKIVGAVPQPSGGGVLNGEIVSYEIFNRNDRKLGEMKFE